MTFDCRKSVLCWFRPWIYFSICRPSFWHFVDTDRCSTAYIEINTPSTTVITTDTDNIGLISIAHEFAFIRFTRCFIISFSIIIHFPVFVETYHIWQIVLLYCRRYDTCVYTVRNVFHFFFCCVIQVHIKYMERYIFYIILDLFLYCYKLYSEDEIVLKIIYISIDYLLCLYVESFIRFSPGLQQMARWTIWRNG